MNQLIDVPTNSTFREYITLRLRLLDHPQACYNLACTMNEGRILRSDQKVAITYHTKAAEKGLPESQYHLGMILIKTGGNEKDVKAGAQWMHKAADQGYVPAQALLGSMYSSGIGVNRDEEKSFKWHLKAANQSDVDAQVAVGVYYTQLKKDPVEGFKWCRKAAEQGDSQAECNLGTMYVQGQGVQKDDKEAVRWFRKAAWKGNTQAQCQLGIMHARGRGVPKDEQKGFKWCLKAAEAGGSEGQLELGKMYMHGIGIKQDIAEAMRWCRKAADQGNKEAALVLQVTSIIGIEATKNAVSPPPQPAPKSISPTPLMPSLPIKNKKTIEIKNPPKPILKTTDKPDLKEELPTAKNEKRSTFDRIVSVFGKKKNEKNDEKSSASPAPTEPSPSTVSKRKEFKRTHSAWDLKPPSTKEKSPLPRSVSLMNLGKKDSSSSEVSPSTTPRGSKRLSRKLSNKDLKAALTVPEELKPFKPENYSKLKKALDKNVGKLSNTKIDENVIIKTFKQLEKDGRVDYRQNDTTITVTVKGTSHIIPFICHAHSKPDMPWYEKPAVVADFFRFLEEGFPDLLKVLGWKST